MDELINENRFSSPQEELDSELRPRRNPTVDNIKVNVAEGLKSAAASLKQKGPQTGAMSDYAGHAADWLDNAADYVEDLSVPQVKSDIQRHVRTNPGRSLLIAGAVGLLVGVFIRRR